MNYTIQKGKIKSENGIPYLPRWFCDERLTCESDEYGISEIQYFNRSTKGLPRVFVADMWGGIKFYIENHGLRNTLNLKKTEIMPYGFIGEWQYRDYVFLYEYRIVNDSIVITLKTDMDCPDEINFTMEFYDSFSLNTQRKGDYRYTCHIERIWDDWTFQDGCLTNCYREEEGETHIVVNANAQIAYTKRRIGNPKNILSIPMLKGKESRFVISFDTGKEAAMIRSKRTIAQYDQLAEIQNNRYETRMEQVPVLESPYEALNDFFALAPLYHESCKIQSVPGAIRAKTEIYWVWGWDGMSSSFAYAYWGDADYIPDLLTFYEETADPKKGIAHNFARDFSHIETSMVSAQGFFIALLYQLYLNGGDIAPHYPFAKKIFHMIGEEEVEGIGLCKGYSLFPDFRNAIMETGNDLSSFNNSSTYCALRSMQVLAQAMQDMETYKRAQAHADRLAENFNRVLFHDQVGFYAASAEASTLEKRNVFMSPAIKWDNVYAYDLIRDKKDQILEFFEKNFLCKQGIRFVPVWDEVYDLDANQLHDYWPSNGEYYTRLINFADRKDLIDQFVGWISYWTKLLMCPEGIHCYEDTDTPKPDEWTSINGAWQTYSMRAWYEAVVHSVVGVDFDENGMNFYPYSGEEMALKNLQFRHKTFDVSMKGSGTEIEKVVLNGTSLGSVRRIAWELFEPHNKIEVTRCRRK